MLHVGDFASDPDGGSFSGILDIARGSVNIMKAASLIRVPLPQCFIHTCTCTLQRSDSSVVMRALGRVPEPASFSSFTIFLVKLHAQPVFFDRMTIKRSAHAVLFLDEVSVKPNATIRVSAY